MTLAPLDLTTLAFTRGLVQIILAALMFATLRVDQSFRGSTWWPVGFLASGIALVSLPISSPEHELALNAVNHLLSGFAWAALLLGFWRFNQQGPRLPLLALICILPATSLALWQIVTPNPPLRIVTTALAQLVGMLALFATLSKPYRDEMRLPFRGIQLLILAYLPVFVFQYAGIAERTFAAPAWMGASSYSAVFSLVTLLFTLSLAVSCIGLQFLRISVEHADRATTDWLTGLINRRGLNLFAAQDDARRRRDGGTSAVICLDIDHFKAVNDRYGHASGDLVLQCLAEVLRNDIRKRDIAIRQGGEEFAVLLVGSGEVDAMDVAERIRRDFSTQRIDTASGTIAELSLSAGVAVAAANRTILQAMDLADTALYEAKRSGRNRVCAAAV
ncbi:GGDEF domain-containing protein [Niveibacterium umoris]|uniref:diguanylate cyclase n=1 Tax=Niveibacterium umoris TaxID=1193620 RepID=A0A840BIU1_9RHOO|nr:GGDEF domain-containing protein [Niveibacterium umoris]MBB4012553.1 diguanylate cyclase (GGDEF)-like protein [Niveibacterium umoris]